MSVAWSQSGTCLVSCGRSPGVDSNLPGLTLRQGATESYRCHHSEGPDHADRARLVAGRARTRQRRGSVSPNVPGSVVPNWGQVGAQRGAAGPHRSGAVPPHQPLASHRRGLRSLAYRLFVIGTGTPSNRRPRSYVPSTCPLGHTYCWPWLRWSAWLGAGPRRPVRRSSGGQTHPRRRSRLGRRWVRPRRCGSSCAWSG